MPATPKAVMEREEGRLSLRGVKEVGAKKVVIKCELWMMRAAMLMQLARMKPTLPKSLVRKREEVRNTKENRSIVRLYLQKRASITTVSPISKGQHIFL